MTTMTSSSTSDLTPRQQLEIIELKPGLKFSRGVLKDLLPDVETALFFGKVYELDAVQLSTLLRTVLDSTLAQALLNEGDAHSTDLQDYVLDLAQWAPEYKKGDRNFSPDVPKGEILPELWKSLELEVAQSIKDVAAKLESVIGLLPGKKGSMVFQTMAKMNLRRPTIGDHRAQIHHAPTKPNLVVLDVSGSMTSTTVETIIDDVVALSYMADAHLAIVSNTCTHWEPGTFGTDDVLAKAEYGGTQYEMIAPLFSQDWGVVVTIADYDSSRAAIPAIRRMTGNVDECLDISLVGRPTFLAEVVGERSARVRPLLVAQHNLCSGY